MKQWVGTIAVWAMVGVAYAGETAPKSAPRACFPAQIGDLRAMTFSQEDHDTMHQNRLGKIYGYNARPYRTALTVYLMDKTRAASVEQEFGGAASEIVAAHPGAESAMRGPAQLSLAGQPTDGQMGVFLWSEGGKDVGSFLWIGEAAGRVIKIRLSYVRSDPDDQATEATRYAMSALRDVAEHICEPGRAETGNALKKPSHPEAS